VLRRPIETARVTGNLGTGTNLSGKRALISRIPAAASPSHELMRKILDRLACEREECDDQQQSAEHL